MKEQIREKALELGFDVCGFAEARPLDHLRSFYRHFIEEERQANMAYLERYENQRIDPEVLLPGVKTVIAVLLNYYPPELLPEEDNFIISKYAYGKRYPPFIKPLLNKLAGFVDSFNKAGNKSMVFVDSGPVLEKAWAMRCGIGWQGKHTILINPSGGSYYFIGIVLTTAMIEPDVPVKDHCGSCTRCMDACPTGAIDRPYQLDIRRCISYCTLVDKAEFPAEVSLKAGGRIFGCDICQDVCPYNRFATPTRETWFHPSEALKKMSRREWINLSKEQFHEMFAGTSVGEKGYERLMSNIRNVTSEF
ncbi:MAG: tRNA epoxyqueuosine(34) reductase QueG [Bacteroidetes bacterium]|nr:tRNA epoxyqueuosine(34) reductase QueG [Bacteroidota bacterium]